MTAKRLGAVCVSTLVILLGSFHPAAAAETGTREYNFNIFLGQRVGQGQLPLGQRSVSSSWAPYEHYNQIGLQSSWGKKDALLLFAWDVFYSADKITTDGGVGPSLHSKTWQFNPGFRKFWFLKKSFMPYLGIGGVYVTADYEYLNQVVVQDVVYKTVQVDMDHSWGFWMDGGFMFRAGSTMNIGVSVRWEAIKPFNIAGESRSGNTLNVGLLLGWGSKYEAAK